MGGLSTAAMGHVNTGPARLAFAARFYEGIPEDVPQRERDRRAVAARRLHFTRLALRSSVARGKRKAPPAIVTPGGATSREGTVNARRSTP